MSPIKVGVVGLSADGWAGRALINPLLHPSLSDKYTITALSTRSSASAAATASKYSDLTNYPIKPFHGDSSQIANDPDVDLVVVSVRTPSHKQAALPVIAAGKDLFLEWPCGNGTQETKALWEAAKKKNVKTMAGLQGRQSPAILQAKEWISSGKIGRVLSTSILLNVPHEFKAWGPTISERNNYIADSKNGATMLDIPVGQFLAGVMHVLGDFSSVSATARTQYTTSTEVDATGSPTGNIVPQTGPDQIAFSGVLKSGAVISLHCRGGYPSTKGRKSFLWIIDGEEGSIQMESDQLGGSSVQILTPKVYLNGEEIKVGDEEDSLGNTGRAWVEFAKGEKGKYPSFEDAINVHNVLDAITASFKEGRRVDVESI